LKKPPYGWLFCFGDGHATLSAQAVLVVSYYYAISWKQTIDYTVLARKRWVDKLSMDTLAVEFGMGRTTVIRHLGIIHADPDLIRDGKVRSMIKSRKYRFMGSE